MNSLRRVLQFDTAQKKPVSLKYHVLMNKVENQKQLKSTHGGILYDERFPLETMATRFATILNREPLYDFQKTDPILERIARNLPIKPLTPQSQIKRDFAWIQKHSLNESLYDYPCLYRKTLNNLPSPQKPLDFVELCALNASCKHFQLYEILEAKAYEYFINNENPQHISDWCTTKAQLIDQILRDSNVPATRSRDLDYHLDRLTNTMINSYNQHRKLETIFIKMIHNKTEFLTTLYVTSKCRDSSLFLKNGFSNIHANIEHFVLYPSSKIPSIHLDSLNFCLLSPSFSYICAFETFKHLRQPYGFLTPKVVNQLNRNIRVSSHNIFVNKPTTENKFSLEGIIIVPLFFDATCSLSKDTPTIDIKWEETLLHTLMSLTEIFPTPRFRYFTLIDIDMRSFLYSYCRESLHNFFAQLLLEFNCDVHWTTRGDESDWIKRWVIALEKCEAGHAPCAFRTRVTHSMVAKHPTGVKKNWISQLIQIPGVDYAASVAIAERFPTPNDIISFIITQQKVKDAVSHLSTIMIDRGKGPKPLGFSIASRLYYFFNINSKRTDWIIPDIN